MRCEGRKTLSRKVERMSSRTGEGVGVNVGRAPCLRREGVAVRVRLCVCR